MILDFTRLLEDAKAGSAWPVGDYDFECIEADSTQSGGAEPKPMIKVTLRCLNGPYANKSIKNNFVVSTENSMALRIFFRHMSAFGLTGDFFKQIGSGDLAAVAINLTGKRATITIKHREWQGETQNDVAAIKPLGGGSPVSSNGGGMNLPTPPTVSTPISTSVPTPPATPPTAPQPPAPLTVATAPTAAAPSENVPPGYDPAVWASFPQAAKDAILATLPKPEPEPEPAADPVPPGFTDELWKNMPESAKSAIRASLQGVGASASPPPPPTMPV